LASGAGDAEPLGRRQMKTAKPTDWKTQVLPSKKTTIRLDRTFSPQEMKRIRRGLVPEQMEDKWFILASLSDRRVKSNGVMEQ